jgi:hypothetical protein
MNSRLILPFLMLVLSLSPVRAADSDSLTLGFEAGDFGLEPNTFKFTHRDPEGPLHVDFQSTRIQVGTSPVVTGGMEVREDDGAVIERQTLRFGFRDVDGTVYLDVAFPALAGGSASYAALILFPKENLSTTEPLTFDSGQPLSVVFDHIVGINNPALADGEIRFVVQNGPSFFVSQEVFSPGIGDFLELPDPASAAWAPFFHDKDLFFQAESATFAPHDFQNVEAVGFLISIPFSSMTHDPLLRFSEFKATLSPAK